MYVVTKSCVGFLKHTLDVLRAFNEKEAPPFKKKNTPPFCGHSIDARDRVLTWGR